MLIKPSDHLYINMNKIDALGIYIKGDFAGVDNEAALEIIEMAVNKGVEINAGRKEAMSLAFAGIWLDGYMAGCGATDENVIRVMKDSINKYYFI